MNIQDRIRNIEPGAVLANAAGRFRSRPFLFVMVGAAVVLGIYLFVLASPLYVSGAKFLIRGKEPSASVPVIPGLPAISSGPELSEAISVMEYIHSHDMLRRMQEAHDLRAIYARFRLDPLATMSSSASEETFLAFYQSMIEAIVDRDTNIISLNVRGFTPDEAQAQAQSLLAFTVEYVNGLSAQIRDATVSSALARVAEARTEVLEARQALARFRNATGDLDPAQTGTASVGQIFDLETEIVRLEAQIAGLRTITSEASPQIGQIRSQIAFLRAEVSQRRAALAGMSPSPDGGGETLAERLVEYEGLVVQREYADQRLVAALAALDAAELLATDRQRFVVPVVSPNLPQEATEPQRIADFILYMTLVLVAYGIVSLAIAGIQEHQGFGG